METPSPQEARRALEQLAQDEDAVRYPPLPWWFFLAQFYRNGVFGVSPSLRDMLPFLTGLLGTFLGCLVIEETTGLRWGWTVGAVVAVGIVLRTGSTYRRTYGDAA